MPPKSVLHKRNGHRHPPKPTALSLGEIVGLVHSDAPRASDLSHDLLRFASIVRSEELGGGSASAIAEGASLPLPLARAIHRTREDMERGELADMREELETLHAQADLATRTIARLAEAPRDPDRRLVNLNDLVADALTRFSGAVVVESQLDARLPRIVGDSRQLREILVMLVAAAGRVMRAAGREGVITVETSRGEGVLQGEDIVRVRITGHYAPAHPGDGPAAGRPSAELDSAVRPAEPLRVARRVVSDHGGVLSVVRLPEGGVCFTLELPAV